MRKLKTRDVPVLCRSLKKIGIKDKFKEVAERANTIKDVWSEGFDIVWDLFDAATEKNGEQAIYDFLAGPFEMTPEQVADLDLQDLVDNLKQLAEENNLLAFFKSAAKLMK